MTAEQWPHLPADGSQGVVHDRPSGGECSYLAIIVCNKCGWHDPDPVRVATASASLSRIASRDPLCECGEPESSHLVLPRDRRGACTFMDAARTCKCAKFTLAGET